MGRGPDSDEADNPLQDTLDGTLDTRPGSAFNFQSEAGFWRRSEDLRCRLDNADPVNLQTDPPVYFWDDSRNCLLEQVNLGVYRAVKWSIA
jgi:hypothetical protein